LINRGTDDLAEGHILIDDGITNDNFDENKFVVFKVRYAAKTINFWPE
jgi:hypothetical protein